LLDDKRHGALIVKFGGVAIIKRRQRRCAAAALFRP
jgi:hypothetical protein